MSDLPAWARLAAFAALLALVLPLSYALGAATGDLVLDRPRAEHRVQIEVGAGAPR